MANISILAQIDAEIAKLMQVRSLLANTGKIADQITERLTKKPGRPAKTGKVGRPAKTGKVGRPAKAAKVEKARQGCQDQEAPHAQPRGAPADCRCAAQALGRAEVQGITDSLAGKSCPISYGAGFPPRRAGLQPREDSYARLGHLLDGRADDFVSLCRFLDSAEAPRRPAASHTCFPKSERPHRLLNLIYKITAPRKS